MAWNNGTRLDYRTEGTFALVRNRSRFETRKFPNGDPTDDFFDDFNPFASLSIRIPLITVYSLVCFACITGNVLVLGVIMRHRRMRQVTSFLLANLALSDFFVGVFCVIQNLTSYISPAWLIGRTMCKLYYFVQCLSYTASIVILTVISAERYVVIIYPMASKKFSGGMWLKVVIIAAWGLSVAYSLPLLFIYDLVVVSNPGGEEQAFCIHNIHSEASETHLKIYVIVNFVLFYVLPLIIMTTIYLRISLVLWRSVDTAGASTNGDSGLTITNMNARTRRVLRGSSKDGDFCPVCNPREQRSNPRYSLASPGGGNGLASDGPKPPLEFYSAPSNSMNIRNEARLSWPNNQHHVSPQRHRNGCETCKTGREIEEHIALKDRPCKIGERVHRTNSSSSGNHSSGRTETRFSRQMSGSGRPFTPSAPLIARRRVIRLLIAFVVCFAVCVLPHHVRLLWQSFTDRPIEQGSNLLYIPPITTIIFYANSAINPILYAFLSTSFRKALKECLISKNRSRLRCM